MQYPITVHKQTETETIERKIYTDYDDNRYVNYNGDTYLVNGYMNPEIDVDNGPFEPVKQYRKVVDTDEVAHLWAHQVQYEARNAGENFYFEGRSIYSYGSHFEIARLVDVPTEENPVVLFNESTYSNTTSGHQHSVKYSIPHDYKVFSFVPRRGMYRRYTLFDYGTNDERADDYRSFVDYHLSHIEDLRESAPRKRQVNTLRGVIRDFNHHKAVINDFIDTFRCKSIFTNTELKEIERPLFDEFSEFMRVARRVLSAEDRAKERERKREQEKFEYFRDNLEDSLDTIKEYIQTDPVAHWKRTGSWPSLPSNYREDIRYWVSYPNKFAELTGYDMSKININIGRAYLRLNENREQIQTSKGAYINIGDAEKLLKLYDTKGMVVQQMVKKRDSGGEFERFHNERMNIGHFTDIPAINADGDIRFGCHIVPASEVEWVRRTIDVVNDKRFTEAKYNL